MKQYNELFSKVLGNYPELFDNIEVTKEGVYNNEYNAITLSFNDGSDPMKFSLTKMNYLVKIWSATRGYSIQETITPYEKSGKKGIRWNGIILKNGEILASKAIPEISELKISVSLFDMVVSNVS